MSTLTQVGARMVHHGQAEGWRVRLPVLLGRYPAEPTDDDVAEFYRSLWAVLRDATFRDGRWRLCEHIGWDGNDRYEDLVAWCWDGESRWLIVVNLGDATSAAHVQDRGTT